MSISTLTSSCMCVLFYKKILDSSHILLFWFSVYIVAVEKISAIKYQTKKCAKWFYYWEWKSQLHHYCALMWQYTIFHSPLYYRNLDLDKIAIAVEILLPFINISTCYLSILVLTVIRLLQWTINSRLKTCYCFLFFLLSSYSNHSLHYIKRN